MKKGLLISITFLFIYFFFNNVRAEYGSENYNRYASGLGLTASYISIPSQTAFDQNMQGTVEMWIYPTSAPATSRVLISKGASPNQSFLLAIYSPDNKLFFIIGNTLFLNADGSVLSTNVWTHVAATWVNNSGTYTVTFYINGAASGTPVTSAATWNVNTDPVIIGSSQAYPTSVFIGNIDEVRFWGAAKSETHIRENRFVGIGDGLNANAGSSLTSCNNYSGLISSWTFNNSGANVRDDISGYNGSYVGTAGNNSTLLGVPIPYNLALKLPGGTNDNVRIPDNAAFNQTTDGSVELWFKPVSFTAEQVLISKGSTTLNLSFALGVAPVSGKLYFEIGNSIGLNSSGTGLNLNQWNHIVVTWIYTGTYYEVTFYKNGSQNGTFSNLSGTFNINTEPVYVGNSAIYNLPAKGWIDELRFWDPKLTPDQVRNNMFASGKSLTGGLLGLWNFDGNLINLTVTAGLNASFNNGASNNCMFSSYANDTLSGAYTVNFQAHSTTINYATSPNPFPDQFIMRAPFTTIPDNNTTGIADSFLVSTSSTVSSIDLFLSIQHPWVGDLVVSLKAPNGVEKSVINRNGASGDNVLSFFSDYYTFLPSSTEYFAPWGYCKPVTAFGDFGTTPVTGYWTIKCIDAAGADVGVLQGWGIKFNLVTGQKNISSEIPKKYALLQNYPNPFNPVTKIQYQIPKASYVTLKIYDILGKEINTLVSDNLKPGIYEASFDGGKLSNGAYYYRLEAGDFSEVKTMMLIK